MGSERLTDRALEQLAECGDESAVGLIKYRAELGMLQEQISKAVAELKERRSYDAQCRGNTHRFPGGYSRDCYCGRTTERR